MREELNELVITLNGAPMLAKSSLQSISALSTMEAEILALAHACQELFPIMDLAEFLGSVVGLQYLLSPLLCKFPSMKTIQEH